MAVSEHTKSEGNLDIVSWVLNNHTYDQHSPIYIDPDRPTRSLTATETRSLVKKLIAGLKAAGLKKGDVVCVNAFNDVYYPPLLLAIIGAGGIYTGCNPSYTGTEISRHLKSTRSRFFISEVALLSKIADNVLDSNLLVSHVFQFNHHGEDILPGFPSWRELQDYGEASWMTFSSQDEAKATTAALLSTSGTSGLPKSAMHSHHNFIAQSIMIDDTVQKPYEVSRLITLPVFHAFAFPLAHFLPLMQGTPTYIMRRFEMHAFLNHIHDFEITETAIVPTIITNILKSPIKAYKLLRPLRTVWCAGSPLPQLTHNEFFRLLRPTARLLQTWGMTEIGWITTFLWPEKDHSGSVGRLLPGMEAKLVHNNRTIEEDNTQAEVHVRGPSLMQGYLDNPTATADSIDRDGWLRTGDIAYREQGKLYIVDRQKELIKVRGWQISPAELEAQLNLHPAIAESAVIGIPSNDNDTELPRAYVVRAEVRGKGEGVSVGREVTEKDIKTYMAQHLARYKALDGGVRFIDAIPKTSSGKITRVALRKLAAAELAARQELTIKVTGQAKLGGPVAVSGESVQKAGQTESKKNAAKPLPDEGKAGSHNTIGSDAVVGTGATMTATGTETPLTSIESALPSPMSVMGTTSSVSECSSGEEADDEGETGRVGRGHKMETTEHSTKVKDQATGLADNDGTAAHDGDGDGIGVAGLSIH